MRKQTGKPTPPVGGDAFLRQAFSDLQSESTKRAKRIKKHNRGATRSTLDTVKNTVIVLLVGLAGLLGDGLRRETAELKARVASVAGTVQVRPENREQWQPVTTETALADGDLVQTSAESTATLVFPDGSAVALDPNTQFEVRILGYARDGKRERSFMVRQGSVLAHVSSFFGGDIGSEATVCTPTAVAAVRGTAFRVVHDPISGRSAVLVAEGTVAVKTPVAEVETTVGRATVSQGYVLGQPQQLAGMQQDELNAGADALRDHEEPPGFLVNVERRLLSIGDPVLQLIGLAPGAWGYGSIDAARRSGCQEALRRLRTHLEGLAQPPLVLNPVTMAELNLDPRELKRLQAGWVNAMFDSYQVYPPDRYVVRARARDRKRTVYEMDNAEIREIKAP